VKEILLQTADDRGSDGDDNSYGNGLVNAYEAVMMALQYIDGWGTAAGVVTDMATGSPIAGARISVLVRTWDAISRGNGQYSIFIPSDSAWTVKVENEPTHLPYYEVITTVDGDTVTEDFILEGKVGITLTVSFANPNDVSYRSFYIREAGIITECITMTGMTIPGMPFGKPKQILMSKAGLQKCKFRFHN
jgi:hypothetical protein